MKRNKLFDKCLANVDAETRMEVRNNMDYKEQYEKALERAKELLNKQGITVGSYPNREAIETIFPELSESEDERIRKRLLWFLANYTGTWDYPETRMACRAWLEKQKENPKFADSILLDCTSDAKCEDRWFKVAESTPADGRTVLAKDNIGNYLLASFAGGEWLVERYDLDDIPIRHTYVVEWCEIPLCQHDVNEIYRKGVKAGIEIANCNEQKEQKPAECITDEEMKQSRDALHDFKVFATDLAKQFNIDHRRDIDWDNFCAGLLTYLERNKPAEWSEEDEENFEIIDDILYGNIDQSVIKEVDKVKILSWLKSPRPQPKAELTLLDKNIINAAVAFVEQNNHFNCWGGIDKHTVIKALRSLKPSWKPSEEQMEELKKVAYGGTVKFYPSILQSLYDDLLKLKLKGE